MTEEKTKSDWQKSLKMFKAIKKVPLKIWGVAVLLILIALIWPDKKIDPDKTGKTGSLQEMVGDLQYKKTVELEVNVLLPQKLCGIRPGERTFRIPNEVYVMIEGSNYEISDYVRVNKTLPGEPILIGDDGCVEISFAFTKAFYNKRILPQIIPVRFE